MEIYMTAWLAFNVVFGLFTLRNRLVYVYAILTNKAFIQSDLGRMLDLFVLTSIVAYILTNQ